MKEQIQSELRQGISIDEICRKYNLSFKELVYDIFKKEFRTVEHNNRFSTGHLYVHYRHKRYVVVKEGKEYGSYETLEDAIKVRDYFIYNGWYHNRLNDVCKELNIKRCGGNG